MFIVTIDFSTIALIPRIAIGLLVGLGLICEIKYLFWR